jgi:hypothetical protein
LGPCAVAHLAPATRRACSTGPLFPSRRRPNEDAAPSKYREPPLPSTTCVGRRHPHWAVEAVFSMCWSPLHGLTGASPSLGAKSPVAVPVYPKAAGSLLLSTACAGENPIILPSSSVCHPPCDITPSSPCTSTPLLQPAVPPQPRRVMISRVVWTTMHASPAWLWALWRYASEPRGPVLMGRRCRIRPFGLCCFSHFSEYFQNLANFKICTELN